MVENSKLHRDLRPVERFLYQRYAVSEMTVQREVPDLKAWSNCRYAIDGHSIAPEIHRLAGVEIDGDPVGGVVFIATAKQKPGMGRENEWREPKSLWNQT